MSDYDFITKLWATFGDELEIGYGKDFRYCPWFGKNILCGCPIQSSFYLECKTCGVPRKIMIREKGR